MARRMSSIVASRRRRRNYLGPWSNILEGGGYSPEEAEAAAMQCCPTCSVRPEQAAVYPNGRVLTDDVYSMRFAWLSNGKVPPSGLKPHDDLQSEFPYLGVPHPRRWSPVPNPDRCYGQSAVASPPSGGHHARCDRSSVFSQSRDDPPVVRRLSRQERPA